MGNALDAAKFSIEKGNTGVGTKKTLLEGIDNFATGVKTWKENIDEARLKLKTDTASKYREAEKEVYENLPSDKTDRDLALKALANYKDQLYGNMGLVQAGMIKPEDNLIFQENGKQSFEILANQINEYAKRREETLKRAKGYYETNEDGTTKLDAQGNPIYVNPVSGAYEASLQDLQSRMGNPEFTDVTFGENGMAKVTFYKTEVDSLTGTRVLVKDADGNPIPIDGLKGMSVLSFDRGRNQRADRLDLQKSIMTVVGPDTPLGQTFEMMSQKGLLIGTIEDNQRANPQLKNMIDDGVATLTSTPDRIVSILSDNGTQSEQSIPLNIAQWDDLTDNQRKETVNYTWVDEKGKTQTGVKSKYIKLVTSANGQIVPELNQRDREAADNIVRSSIHAALKKDITDKGTKLAEFDPYRESKTNAKNEEKDFQASVDLIDLAATGDASSLKALVAENPDKISAYDITGTGKDMQLVFLDTDGNRMAPISLSGLGVDAGKQIAAQLQLKSQRYFDKSKLKGTNKKAGGTESSYKTVTKEYAGLGAFNLGVSESDGIKRAGTAAEVFASATENNPDEEDVIGVANTIIQKAMQEYDIDSNIQVSNIDESGPNDRYVITVNGVDYKSPAQSSRKNHTWLQANIDRVLRGEEPSGTAEGVDYKTK